MGTDETVTVPGQNELVCSEMYHRKTGLKLCGAT
jgi:hypothetical protein